MKNRRIKTITWLSPALLLTACGGAQQPSGDKPLNIVFIITDDHSFQTISAYDHPLSRLAPTPHIDRLASEGTLFRQAFVENSLSTPSRACLMTGLYSHQNGQRRLGAGIDTTKTFVSELLRAQGYQTGVIGKWHMLCSPKGFDDYHLLWDQGDYYNPAFISPESDGEYVQEEGYATTLITDHAIAFIDAREKTRPFCLFVEHKAPHRNWMPDTNYLSLYEEVTFPLPETFYDDYATRCETAHRQEMRIEQAMTMRYDLKVDDPNSPDGGKNEPFATDWERSLARMTPAQREAWDAAYQPRNREFVLGELQGDTLLRWKYQRYIKDYLRCIKSIDDEVGRLIKHLEREGLMEHTVIVYTSDQGFYMGEHGWFDKRFMYEESMRTPLIIRHPGNNGRGASSDALVQNIDYAPTLLAIAGIAKPDEMPGRALTPLLQGERPDDWRSALYYHYYDYPAIHRVRRHDGVRDERYKLIHFYSDPEEKGTPFVCDELFDLQSDPHELNNLASHPDYQAIKERLQQRLEQFREELQVDEY